VSTDVPPSTRNENLLKLFNSHDYFYSRGRVSDQRGHRVIATFDTDEAIRVLEKVRGIDLVITDINMPGSMDGLRLADRNQGSMAADPSHPSDRIESAERP
jgi:CheY-like chemotaxis protein